MKIFKRFKKNNKPEEIPKHISKKKPQTKK